MIAQQAGGPYFDDLWIGQVFDQAPAVTLTEGRAALHQALTGSRLRLPLDQNLSRTVSAVLSPILPWSGTAGPWRPPQAVLKQQVTWETSS